MRRERICGALPSRAPPSRARISAGPISTRQTSTAQCSATPSCPTARCILERPSVERMDFEARRALELPLCQLRRQLRVDAALARLAEEACADDDPAPLRRV